MFVQTEPTPNPATLKFLPGKEVMTDGTMFYQNQESASNSPLAMNLFNIKGVEGVFLDRILSLLLKAMIMIGLL